MSSSTKFDSTGEEGREQRNPEGGDSKLVRLRKTVVFSDQNAGHIDESVVNFRFYNAFNYSLVSKERGDFNLTIGVTSARPGEGKTLVASNLAVSLALGQQKETLLVDLHLSSPRIHSIFGTPASPGITEAFYAGSIHVTRTKIERLSVLSAGNASGIPVGIGGGNPFSPGSSPSSRQAPPVGLEQLASFRDIVYSLEQDFDFVIVDLPSMTSPDFSSLFTNQLNGVLIVVDSGKTKREEVDRIFQQLHERQVLGFVMNRTGK
jgi:Mrp family chromosome partitioning ATPase